MTYKQEHINCYGCEARIELVEAGNVETPLAGLSFSLAGYDSGFNDDTSDHNPLLILCHDCVLRLIDLFPRAGREMQRACHPNGNDDDTPCCQYCWTFIDGETHIPTTDLKGWRPLYS